MQYDKRHGPRHPSITEITYEHLGVQHSGRVSDLSRGGFFIDTLNPLPKHSLISFRFVLPGDDPGAPITGEGRVAWQRPLQGMGIRFTRLSMEDQNRLMGFLSPR